MYYMKNKHVKEIFLIFSVFSYSAVSDYSAARAVVRISPILVSDLNHLLNFIILNEKNFYCKWKRK